MRLKKGTKVEVLSDGEMPCGEWRRAHIISGNGHTYSVQYECSSGMTSEAVVERVPRKAIRPCPHLVEGVERWAAHDVVEVYDSGCWKGAVVLKFFGGDFYMVRLLGSCKELQVHKVNTRLRQSWIDGQWVVMRKGSGNSGVGKSVSNSDMVMPELKQAGTEMSQQSCNNCLPGLEGGGIQEPHLATSSTLKRVSPYCYSSIDAYPRKIRVTMKKRESQRLIAVSTAPLLEKVDAVAYPRKIMGEKCMHASFNNNTNQYYEMGKGNPINLTTHCLERIEGPADSCSDMSSVGSCSVISSSPNKFSNDMLEGPSEDVATLSSDAESSDVGDVDKIRPLSPNEVVATRIHRLELQAYCSTLEAMYASGPLSWEQEDLLTNLRISLHISNDEHLMEIRNLVSAGQHF